MYRFLRGRKFSFLWSRYPGAASLGESPFCEPEGNILRDRFKSFQRRNMIEARERAKFKLKYKAKLVEKRAFREIQL
nr:ribosome biogenesis protein NOP53-like [Kogia breviceps]